MYTLKELKEATQIAYISFLEKALANLKADGRKGPFTIRDLIISYLNIEVATALAKAAGIDENRITLKELIKYSDLKDSDKSIIQEFSEDMLDWKIIDIHDTKPVNGFYACCIETSDRDAIIAFRGSEDMKKISNMINDWFRADIGLLNSRSTRQQKEAEKYADEILAKGLLDKYESLAVTGHSLGGNLATHFTISTATEERIGLFKKIKQSVNFDGPGVSEEYIKEHDEKIQVAASKLTHLKWSAVGDLLFDIPGEHIEYLAINEDLYKDDLKKRIKYKIITRHSTKSLLFNEMGDAEKGKQDIVAKGLSLISKAADKVIPECITTELFAAADWIFDKILKIKEGGIIEFGDISWSERFSEKGSILGKCGRFIDGVIGAFKEGTIALKNEINEFLTPIQNTYIPRVAAGNIGGSIQANSGFNFSSTYAEKEDSNFDREY